LRSVWEREGEEPEEPKYCCDIPGPEDSDSEAFVVGSSLNSTLISLPCLELGGGGFFLDEVDDTWNSVVNPRRSSSGSDTSCEVRGDSECASCTGSKIDCLDMEEVSVLLPPSPKP